MRWALCSTPEDLTELEAGLAWDGYAPQDRAKLNQYLQAGFRTWPNAPCIPPEHPCFATDGVVSSPGGTCMRVVEITHDTLTDFRSLIDDLIARYQAAPYLETYAGLLARPWYGCSVFPFPAGFFAGMTCT